MLRLRKTSEVNYFISNILQLNILQDIGICTASGQHTFRAVSRFQDEQLVGILRRVEEVLANTTNQAPPPTIPRAAKEMKLQAEELRIAPKLTCGQEEVFRALWPHKIPLVFTNVNLKGNWSPAAFTASHGDDEATMIDSRKQAPVKVTVAEFFKLFVMDDEERGGVVKLKVIHTGFMT